MNKEKILGINASSIIGMIHCLPLPGTAGYDGDFGKIINRAVQDAVTLEKSGVDAVIIENMGDTPFTALLTKPQVAALTAVTMAVKEKIKIPYGIDAAFNDCEASLSIAAVTGAGFVRIPVFVDTVVYSDGIVYPCANQCINFRKRIQVEHIMILADIQVKHSQMLLPHISVEQSAKDAASNGADGIIVTGVSVGTETPIETIERVKRVVSIPVIAGSGVNATNVKEQLGIADGCIIGSSLKVDGNLANPIDGRLVYEVVDALRK